MANEKEEKVNGVQDTAAAPKVAETKKAATKFVRNRSGHRVELYIDGKVVVCLPGQTTEIPAYAEVPNGLGLYVRK